MLRMLALFVSIGGSATCVLAASALAERSTTHPYYGAFVTLEHGVRVYRPLPLGTAEAESYEKYGDHLYTSNGRFSAPARERAYEWRPGFYRVLARGERH